MFGRRKRQQPLTEHRHIGVTLKVSGAPDASGMSTVWEIPGIPIFCTSTGDAAMYHVDDKMLPPGVRVSIHGTPYSHSYEPTFWMNEYSHPDQEGR